MESWPLKKLLANINRITASSTRLAVLLSTGALNPVHNGHVDILERAKRFLEQDNKFCVVGGFLSPSHDLYVYPKCRRLNTLAFASSERLKLTQLACQASEWIDTASWESQQQGYWPDFPEVLQALQDHLAASPNSSVYSFTVFYVCGRDHADKCGLHNGFGVPNQGVVIVPRSGDPPAASNAQLLVFGVTEVNAAVEHLSSTAVRAVLQSGAAIPPDWMPQAAAEELRRLYAALNQPAAPPGGAASAAAAATAAAAAAVAAADADPAPSH